MKKLFLMVIVAFSLTACNGGKTENSATTAADSTKVSVDTATLAKDTTKVDTVK